MENGSERGKACRTCAHFEPLYRRRGDGFAQADAGHCTEQGGTCEGGGLCYGWEPQAARKEGESALAQLRGQLQEARALLQRGSESPAKAEAFAEELQRSLR